MLKIDLYAPRAPTEPDGRLPKPSGRGAMLLLAALVVCLFATAAMPARAEKWSFIFFADTQDPAWGPWMNTNIMAELAVAITNERPDFVLFGGDLANHPQPPAPPAWTNIMAPLTEAGIPVYATLGNHDNWEVPGFVRAFGPTHPNNGPEGEIELTYALRHQNALVLGLNAFNPTNEYRVNQAWVDAVLATNTLPHVFAFSHPAAFKLLHGNCLGAHPTQRDALWNSLTRAGSRMFFCGHDHFYDHSRIDDGDGNPDNDIHQFIVGTGGAALYADSKYDGMNGKWTPVRVLHEANHGYLLVEVDGDTVSATWKRRAEPSVYVPGGDFFTYTLSRPAEPPRLHAVYETGALVLSWQSAAQLEASPHLSGTFTNVPSATSPHRITDLPSTHMFYRLRVPKP